MRSAVSSDGVHWTPEAGIRCVRPVCFGQPAIVALPTGGWRFFMNDDVGIYSAVTHDGLTFAREPGLRLRFSAFHTNPGWHFTGCHIVKTKEGVWRMYFGDTFGNNYVPTPLTQIYSANSENLLDWTVDPGVRTQGVAHPFVWLRPDGSYQMFASALGQADLDAQTLYTATSPDGLTWSDLAATGLIGGDPVAFQLADGKLRLYYNDIRLMPTILSGFYSAQMVDAPWGVSVDRQTPKIGASIIHITVQVMGRASAITVQAVDRARGHTVPIAGLPYAGTAPFQVNFDMPNSSDQLIEVTDGTIARLFLPYGPSTADSPA
ncbi:MAG TPA: hypothetical protein VFR68_13390 [Candidatus Dormibacteraeota bacterium]|nr:hypothetical protein [Candidatus Dormibacteraeota bacterium]